jgi:hypothetical protein
MAGCPRRGRVDCFGCVHAPKPDACPADFQRVAVDDAGLARQVVGCSTARGGQRAEYTDYRPPLRRSILCNPVDEAHGQRGGVVGPFRTSKPSGIARARKGRCNDPAMSTKSRDTIYGGAIRGANIRAKSAREAARRAAQEADRAEAQAFGPSAWRDMGDRRSRRPRSGNVSTAASVGSRSSATAVRPGQAYPWLKSAGRGIRRSGNLRRR